MLGGIFSRFRTDPLVGNVIALIALGVAVGLGTAYAAGLAPDSVTSRQIADNQVRGTDVKESTLRGVVRGSGRVVADRTFMANGTTAARRVLGLPGFGRITGDCPNGATPTFIFKNKTSENIEVVEAHWTGSNDYEVVAPDGTATLGGDAESPRQLTWRFAIGNEMATVWPLSQKPSSGSDCHVWMHALITR